jgi:hypothetical protein
MIRQVLGPQLGNHLDTSTDNSTILLFVGVHVWNRLRATLGSKDDQGFMD